MTPNHVKLTICGVEYFLTTTQPEEYLKKLAKKMEHDIGEFTSPNYGLSVNRATVLTALGYLDEMERADATVENMRAQLKNYLEDAAKAKVVARQAHGEMLRLKQENEELNRKLSLALDQLEKVKL